MGLAIAASHVVWALAIVVAVSTLAPPLLDAFGSQREASTAAIERGESRLVEEVVTTRVLYDGVAGTLLIVASNAGEAPLDVSDLTVLVDGRALTGATAVVPGRGATDVWFPGEQANLTVPGVTALPDRVLLAYAVPSGHALRSDGVIDEYAVRFTLGSGAANARHVHAARILDDGRSFSAEVKMKPGGDTVVKDLVRLENPGVASRTIQLSASKENNPRVEALSWRVYNGTTLVATLDYKQASPSASFALPSGQSFRFELRMDLADSATKQTTNGNFGLTMVVT